MKKLLGLTIFTLLCFSLTAQKSFGHVIIGLESGFDVAQFSRGLKAKASPALQAEVSLGPISLGVGVGRKIYGAFDFYTSKGETIQHEDNMGVLKTYYLAD